MVSSPNGLANHRAAFEYVEIMRSFQEYRFEAKLLWIDGNQEDDFQRWGLGIKSALQSSEIFYALEDESVNNIIDELALATVISCLGDKHLRPIQIFTITISARDKLHLRYAGILMVNKHSLWNTSSNTKLNEIKKMGNHMALLDSHFSRFETMETTIEKSMRVAGFSALLSSFTGLAPGIASVSTLPKCCTTWDYVSMLFIEEGATLSQ